jgi:hypothetical protein
MLIAGAFGNRSLAAPTAREIWPDIHIYPVDVMGDCIGVGPWIFDHVGQVTVGCSHTPFVFGGGLTEDELPIMRAGAGLHAYLVVTRAGTPSLRLAVSLPSMKREDARELGLVLDGDPIVLGTADPKRSLVVNNGDTRLVVFDLPAADNVRERLSRVGEAKERYVSYGEGGSRKYKITKANAKSIAEMLRVYEAIVKTPGIRAYDR